MRKLYEIQEDIEKLIELDAERFVDGETGEIVNREVWDSLQIEWSQKIEGVACGYKNEMAIVTALKNEVDELNERIKRHSKKAEGYKSFLNVVLEGKKFESSKCAIKPTKSKVCEWDGNTEGLDAYMVAQPPKFDKATARKDLIAGKSVPHCTLVEKTSVSIK